jgi:hypothetical protein
VVRWEELPVVLTEAEVVELVRVAALEMHHPILEQLVAMVVPLELLVVREQMLYLPPLDLVD